MRITESQVRAVIRRELRRLNEESMGMQMDASADAAAIERLINSPKAPRDRRSLAAWLANQIVDMLRRRSVGGAVRGGGNPYAAARAYLNDADKHMRENFTVDPQFDLLGYIEDCIADLDGVYERLERLHSPQVVPHEEKLGRTRELIDEASQLLYDVLAQLEPTGAPHVKEAHLRRHIRGTIKESWALDRYTNWMRVPRTVRIMDFMEEIGPGKQVPIATIKDAVKIHNGIEAHMALTELVKQGKLREITLPGNSFAYELA